MENKNQNNRINFYLEFPIIQRQNNILNSDFKQVKVQNLMK